MGILDDAIREHLDLKRKHGARDSELREIEDEALGSGGPDPFAAGGEFFNEPSGAAPSPEGGRAEPPTPPPGLGEPVPAAEEPTRLVEPERGEPEGLDLEAEEPLSPPEGLRQVPGQERLEEPIPGQQRLDEPSASAPLDTETGFGATDIEPPAPSESLEELISEEEPFPEDSAAPHARERPAPPPEAPDSVEEASPEAESSVPEPPPPPPETGPEPAGRARGRVDVPTEEHPPPGETGGLPPLPAYEDEHDVAAPADEAPPVEESRPAVREPEPEASGPALYDFETDEDSLTRPEAAPADTEDDFEALGPAEEERPYLEEEEPYAEEPVSSTETPIEEPGTAVRPALEDEEAYEGGSLEAEEGYEESEGEDLWFEKGPPEDFDFEED